MPSERSWDKILLKNGKKRVLLRLKPGLEPRDSWPQHMYHLQKGIMFSKFCAVCKMRG